MIWQQFLEKINQGRLGINCLQGVTSDPVKGTRLKVEALRGE